MPKPHWVTIDGLRMKVGSPVYKWFVKNKKRLGGVFKRPPKPVVVPVSNPVPPKQPVEMFDDVNPRLIPVDAIAVAGYVDGHWPDYDEIVKLHPHAKFHVSVAVFAKDDADALDVEPGDATVAQADAWVRREHTKGRKRPIVYAPVSWAAKLVATLAAGKLEYGRDYLFWSAHYTGKPHLCSPKCGFGFKQIAHATQWTDKAEGKSLDESLCAADFFPAGTAV